MPVCEAGYYVLQLLQWALCKQNTEQQAAREKKSLHSRRKKIQGLKILVYSDLNKRAEMI